MINLIDVQILKSNDHVLGFTIIGHSNSAPKGQDIYCAGVSALSQAAYLCLENIYKYNFVSYCDSGKLHLKLIDRPDDITEAIFNTMITGLTEISKLVPTTVSIRCITE